VLASVKEIEEIKNNDQMDVQAQCEVLQNLKGKLETPIFIKYTRTPNLNPPNVLLFQNLMYVFFLKKIDDKWFTLINNYEGAYIESRSFINELKIATKNENRFDPLSGQEKQGLQIFARVESETISQQNDVIIDIIIQNVGDNEIELYHNDHVGYFILFHLFDNQGNQISTQYPKKNSVPPIDKNYFVKLESGAYVTTPSFNLKEYCKLDMGQYTLYVEFHLPNEYSGQNLGKTGWANTIISNKITLNIVE
jgi:hypothetical protein